VTFQFGIREGNFSDGMHMERKQEREDEMSQRVKDLQHQVDELKELVNTLLSVIVEEPDGVHSGAAPTLPGQGMMQVCM
jgi:hypothetical protein